MEIDYAGFSIKGKLHEFNEDRYRMLGEKAPLIRNADRGQVFAVFDGMGSAPKGREAAQFMCDSLINFFKDVSIEAAPKGFIELLNNANFEINNWGYIEGTKKKIGACAGTIVWINNEDLFVYHAGDTLCLLIRPDYENDNEYELLTTDQAIGDDLLAFWGMGETLRIEAWELNIAEGDILVLISDGVLKAIDLKTIAKKIRKWIFNSLEFSVKSLCELAEMRGSTDDITAVIVEIIDFDA
jgi:PPM family protein phosphatase